MLDGIMQNTIDQAGSRLQTYASNGMISLALEERPCRDRDETHTHKLVGWAVYKSQGVQIVMFRTSRTFSMSWFCAGENAREVGSTMLGQ